LTDHSPDAPGRRRTPPGGWWSRTARKLHLTLAIALPGCLAAGWFELDRARNGREIAWVYAFEWPLYGVLGIYMWWRLLHPDASGTSPAGDAATVSSADPPIDADVAATVDAELAAWQAYMARLQKIDPPGAPPQRNRERPRTAQ
jgi:hypothetical protein